MTTVSVAVVRAGSVLFDPAATVAKAERYIREATFRGAELIVLPEAFLGGYPKGRDFGVIVGSRSAAGRELFRRYVDAAVTVPGPETQVPAGLAAELGVHLVAGAIERDGATLYCTALFLPGRGAGGPGGAVLRAQRQPVPHPHRPTRRRPPPPRERPGDGPDRRGSTIVSPLGEVLAGPLRGAEGVLVAEFDLDEVTRAKFDLDTVGHYARPDVFGLTVDETPRACVHTTGGNAPGPREQLTPA